MSRRDQFADHLHRLFSALATHVALAAGHPAAFAIAYGSILLWLFSGPIFHWSDTWQLVVNTATTIITFLMVFLIQNSQNRDGVAMQAKLDELIRAVRSARNDFIGIEHLTDLEIEEIRRTLEARVGRLTVVRDGEPKARAGVEDRPFDGPNCGCAGAELVTGEATTGFP